MDVTELDYDLPTRLLASQPRELRGEKRHDGRMLVMHKKSGVVEIRRFEEITAYLSAGDVVVLNNSQTLNASFFAHVDGVGRMELQLRSNPEGLRWLAGPRPWRPAPIGSRLRVGESDAHATVVGERETPPLWLIEFDKGIDLFTVLAEHGRPIPSPYVDKSYDNAYYNTVYASIPGSAEMPAAGRHFTDELLDTLAQSGVTIAYITLHTGLSSVNVEEEKFEDHSMYEEWFSIDAPTADVINKAKESGRTVLVVGTTVMRVLESVATDSGHLDATTGWTDLYIHPGHRFKVADAFVTNFHGPRTSRIALAAAFTGKDLLLEGYHKAIAEELLFFEFGDATLTLPD